ncbi:hypothetical protein [Glycomyces harbinensis]|uniref:hypothetical protein n=1 Tax=Glycomyces harbinensis TaxID=58114 RepID=UPI000B867A43|nr:hypothetical protein [Glycomyces harbinensis]
MFEFSEVTDLASRLSALGWRMAATEVWDDSDEDTFADAGRTVLAVAVAVARTFRVSVSVSATAPDERLPRTALIERGQYLACATGEKLHFTDALCRLPLTCDADALDLNGFREFAIGDHLAAACTACAAHWTVDLAGDFHALAAGATETSWSFDDAEDLDHVTGTIACVRRVCKGRIAFDFE